MHGKNFNGNLEIFFSFASVDKNISRKFLKGISLYNNGILIHAWLQSQSSQPQATCYHESGFYCIYIKSTK